MIWIIQEAQQLEKINPTCKFGVTGGIRPITHLIADSHADTIDYRFNNYSKCNYGPAKTPPFTETATQTSTNATDNYTQSTGNGTVSIPSTMTCDCSFAGAGGRGGAGAFAGGNDACEVAYHPSLNLISGTYDIRIGVDSATPATSISKITYFTNESVPSAGVVLS